MNVYGKCWSYQGCLWDGYGMARVEGRTVLVHRMVYEALMGPIPADLQIDHLCRNRSCYNPAHLEVVTQQENIRRGSRANQTVCKHGHSLEDASLVKIGKTGYYGRRCRTCHRLREQARKLRKRNVRG